MIIFDIQYLYIALFVITTAMKLSYKNVSILIIIIISQQDFYELASYAQDTTEPTNGANGTNVLPAQSPPNSSFVPNANDYQLLINEIRACFINITFLSIDGQAGESEREKYYKFYDSIEHYLKLLKVSPNFSSSSSLNSNSILQTADLTFKRTLKTIEFELGSDPFISSFFMEFFHPNGTRNGKFDYYEDFINFTDFGRNYAKNVTFIRNSVAKFDKVASHLLAINFTSQLTRPSAKFQNIRRLSRELYSIKHDLEMSVPDRVLANRQDVARIFTKLDQLSRKHPYIRLLGDQADENAMKLNELLDNYLDNNLTEWSFYDELSKLPDDYIRLGGVIAREFETREIPVLSRFDNFNSAFPMSNIISSPPAPPPNLNARLTTNNSSIASNSLTSVARRVDPQGSSGSLFSKLFY